MGEFDRNSTEEATIWVHFSLEINDGPFGALTAHDIRGMNRFFRISHVPTRIKFVEGRERERELRRYKYIT